MRLWSVHPKYLDRQALVACWREALLAQAVLAGRTRGYRSHPQLQRFREHADPLGALGAYLTGVAAEAVERDYRFDLARVLRPSPVADPAETETTSLSGARPIAPITVSTGQLAFEWQHLRAKFTVRSPETAARLAGVVTPVAHPLFMTVDGPIAEWERAAGT